MTKQDEDKMLQIVYDALIKKQTHDFWMHGAGFCQVCGELRKRCECKEFTEYKKPLNK